MTSMNTRHIKGTNITLENLNKKTIFNDIKKKRVSSKQYIISHDKLTKPVTMPRSLLEIEKDVGNIAQLELFAQIDHDNKDTVLDKELDWYCKHIRPDNNITSPSKYFIKSIKTLKPSLNFNTL